MNDRLPARLEEENERLRARVAEAEETLRALRAGEVDAVLVFSDREQVFTLESADKPYRLLVEQMPQGAATLTTEGVILYANHAFATLLGMPLQTLVGRSILEFVAGASQVDFGAMLLAAQAAAVRREVTLRLRSGAESPVFLSASALHEGPLGVCIVITDLTEQRHYRELQRAQAALRDADRRKDEFLAILSHELRNPLGTIRNAAHYLRMRGIADPDLEGPIEMIERQVEQMARLIDDLLDVSRITRGVLELRRERTSLADVVDAAVKACRDELERRRHTLRTTLPPGPVELLADRARLVQVLCNLIANAGKYTPEGGHVDLVAAVAGPSLELRVRDDGIGIPREKLSEIFDLFEQVDRSLEREGGLGIGLTLVRELVRMHGGTIEAHSDGPGQGSEFVLRAPIVTTAVATPARPARVGTRVARPLRVVIADDNRDAVDSLALLLDHAGHEVHKACDGAVALALVRERLPDVAMLDIGMPRASGYEVAQAIRGESWGRAIHLVALTGWGQQEDKRRAREAGFDAHLVKPVDPRALIQLLASIPRPRAAGPEIPESGPAVSGLNREA